MKLVKCKFLSEDKTPKGREYTYATDDSLAVGEIVSTQDGKEVVITAVDLPPDAAAGFEDKLKSVSKTNTNNEVTAEIGVVENEISISESVIPQDLIIIEQLPVITERLKLVSDEIDIKISKAKALPVTDETIKTKKAMRAALNKDSANWNEKFKAVKNTVLAPWNEFETAYKRYISDKFKTADSDLKAEIDQNETIRKSEKAAEVKAYFEEYASSKHIEIATWEDAGIKVGLTDSVKSLKAQATTFIDRIASDLALIETQEHKEEILVEYKRTLNCSQAITTVAARHKAIAEQKARQAEIEARKAAQAEAVKRVEAVAPAVSAPLAPPVIEAPKVAPPVDSDPIRTLEFSVTHNVSKLRELKRFLDDGGYRY